MSPGPISARPEPLCGTDAMLPVPARILEVYEENFNTRTFLMQLEDEYARGAYRWLPGQFNMLYVPGVGEAAISLSSDADEPQTLGHTIRVVGAVTRAIERLGQGGIVGLRGPFGRGWPIERLDGGDVVMVAGGIGLAPLRPVVYWLRRHRERFRRVILLFGCRSPDDRVYAGELERWQSDNVIDVLVTVDNASGGWIGPVGVVTNLLRRVRVNAARTTVMVCGPRVLNRAAAWNFMQLHVPAEQVYLSLERNMNCGYGQCGHCQRAGKFVCKDGPVFAYSELADTFTTEEI